MIILSALDILVNISCRYYIMQFTKKYLKRSFSEEAVNY